MPPSVCEFAATIARCSRRAQAGCFTAASSTHKGASCLTRFCCSREAAPRRRLRPRCCCATWTPLWRRKPRRTSCDTACARASLSKTRAQSGRSACAPPLKPAMLQHPRIRHHRCRSCSGTTTRACRCALPQPLLRGSPRCALSCASHARHAAATQAGTYAPQRGAPRPQGRLWSRALVPRAAAAGAEPAGAAGAAAANALAGYRRHRMHLGVAEGSAELAGELPLEAGLDGLAAVSFAKGCYLGQVRAPALAGTHASGPRLRLAVAFAAWCAGSRAHDAEDAGGGAGADGANALPRRRAKARSARLCGRRSSAATRRRAPGARRKWRPRPRNRRANGGYRGRRGASPSSPPCWRPARAETSAYGVYHYHACGAPGCAGSGAAAAGGREGRDRASCRGWLRGCVARRHA